MQHGWCELLRTVRQPAHSPVLWLLLGTSEHDGIVRPHEDGLWCKGHRLFSSLSTMSCIVASLALASVRLVLFTGSVVSALSCSFLNRIVHVLVAFRASSRPAQPSLLVRPLERTVRSIDSRHQTSESRPRRWDRQVSWLFF